MAVKPVIRSAVRLNRLLARHRPLMTIVSWTCFAAVCADYARFIDLPSIVTVPFWIGVIANVLRWGLWEGILKVRAESAMNAEMSAEIAEGATGKLRSGFDPTRTLKSEGQRKDRSIHENKVQR